MLKKTIIFLVIVCMFLQTPVQASYGKRVRAKGVYYLDFIKAPKYSGAKLKKYFYKKEKETGNKWNLILKTKLRGRTLKVWGAMRYKKSLKLKGKKRWKKYNKYVFKLSRNVVFYGTGGFDAYTGEHYWRRMSYSEGIGLIKRAEKQKFPWAAGRYYVKNGVVYKIVIP